MVDLERGESFGFLGFDFRYLRSLRGAMRPHYTPKLKKRTALHPHRMRLPANLRTCQRADEVLAEGR